MEKERRMREEREFLCVFVCLFIYLCVSVCKSERYLHPSHTAYLLLIYSSAQASEITGLVHPLQSAGLHTLGISMYGVSLSSICVCAHLHI